MKTNKIVKAFFMLVTAIGIILGMSACGEKSSSNEERKAMQVAKSYCQALANKNFKKAETYCTEGAAFKLSSMSKSKKTLASIASSVLEVDSVSINGNDAIANAHLADSQTKIYLEKSSNGQWLICNPEF